MPFRPPTAAEHRRLADVHETAMRTARETAEAHRLPLDHPIRDAATEHEYAAKDHRTAARLLDEGSDLAGEAAEVAHESTRRAGEALSVAERIVAAGAE